MNYTVEVLRSAQKQLNNTDLQNSLRLIEAIRVLGENSLRVYRRVLSFVQHKTELSRRVALAG